MSRNTLARDIPLRKNLRILLADDHTLVRAGLRALVHELGYIVVAEADNGAEALRLIAQLKPNIVLMDISMSKLSGLEVTAQARTSSPETRIIILAMHANIEYAHRALEAGAAGYVLKNARPAELELAIQLAAEGKIYFSGAVTKFVASNRTGSHASQNTKQLTPRQRAVVRLLVKGFTRKQIAEQLDISVKTFDTYRAQIMALLQIHDTAELIKYVAESGLDLDDLDD